MTAELKFFRPMLALAASIGGCVGQPPQAPAVQGLQSILASSIPAGGSTVAAPVESVKLHFNPPARLDELTISGPDGAMPMMVHSIGEVSDYSIPTAGLDAGKYRADWKAFVGAREYRGSFQFTVR